MHLDSHPSPHRQQLYLPGWELVGWLLLGPALARPALAGVGQSGMVVQRNQPITLWGRGLPGASVRATFGREQRTATAQPDSTWAIGLTARPASTTPASIQAKSRAERMVLADVLVGDVWLCAGQSNMAFPLVNDRFAWQTLHQAPNPLLRLLHRLPALTTYNAPYKPEVADSLVAFVRQHGAQVSREPAKTGLPEPVLRLELVPEGQFREQLEGYALTVSQREVLRTAATAQGLFWGYRTLQQLLQGRPAHSLAGCRITGYPAFPIRGLTHDTGRSFIPVDTLCRHLAVLSHYKLNTFHWHLTLAAGRPAPHRPGAALPRRALRSPRAAARMVEQRREPGARQAAHRSLQHARTPAGQVDVCLRVGAAAGSPMGSRRRPDFRAGALPAQPLKRV